jgi:hypothetical protein
VIHEWSIFLQEEDSRRGITIDGVLTNTAQPLMGLNKCMAWVAPESVAYGNIAPDRRAQLLAITESCSGDDLLSKIYTVRQCWLAPWLARINYIDM